jgi:hypothetical protein
MGISDVALLSRLESSVSTPAAAQDVLVNCLALVVVFWMQLPIRAGDGLSGFVRFEANSTAHAHAPAFDR